MTCRLWKHNIGIYFDYKYCNYLLAVQGSNPSRFISTSVTLNISFIVLLVTCTCHLFNVCKFSFGVTRTSTKRFICLLLFFIVWYVTVFWNIWLKKSLVKNKVKNRAFESKSGNFKMLSNPPDWDVSCDRQPITYWLECIIMTIKATTW